jgi:hypothetical protein
MITRGEILDKEKAVAAEEPNYAEEIPIEGAKVTDERR